MSDLAVFEDEDLFGVADSGKSVGDHDEDLVGHKFADRLLDEVFVLGALC